MNVLVLAQSIVTLSTVVLLAKQQQFSSRKLGERDLIKANRGGTNAIESL